MIDAALPHQPARHRLPDRKSVPRMATGPSSGSDGARRKLPLPHRSGRTSTRAASLDSTRSLPTGRDSAHSAPERTRRARSRFDLGGPTEFTEPPLGVRIAFYAFVIALLTACGETAVHTVTDLGRSHPAEVSTGLVVRLSVYLVVFGTALRMRHGSRWARRLLAVGIGVVGLASLLLEPLAQLLSADHFSELFDDVTAEFALIFALRAIHVLAVLVAIPAMYYRTNGFFRPAMR